MNSHVSAEELDRQIEKLVSGKVRRGGMEASSLLAIASELQLLPDPDFRHASCGGT